MKEEKGDIERLIQEKLNGVQAPVNPELWAGIAQKIATPTASSGFSTFLSKGALIKLVTAVLLVSGLVVVTYYEFGKDDKKGSPEQEMVQSAPVDSQKKQNELQTEVQTQASIELSSQLRDSSAVEKFIVNKREKPAIVFQPTQQNTDVKEQSQASTRTITSELPKEETAEVVEKTEDKVTKETNGEQENVVVDRSTEAIETEAQQEHLRGEITLFPNVFSPNNDGSNDFLIIQSKNLEDFTVVVLDSTGLVVFNNSDPNFKWNGRGVNGELVPSGKYILYVVAKDANGQSVSQSGSLLITH